MDHNAPSLHTTDIQHGHKQTHMTACGQIKQEEQDDASTHSWPMETQCNLRWQWCLCIVIGLLRVQLRSHCKQKVGLGLNSPFLAAVGPTLHTVMRFTVNPEGDWQVLQIHSSASLVFIHINYMCCHSLSLSGEVTGSTCVACKSTFSSTGNQNTL